ncbi:hypothetical protein, partial [Butyricicoccus sp.]|uniref:hypothetical protein n=1 Tax=Butyricicoccus sp. TaxID=2049021 RepID=UPI003F145333
MNRVPFISITDIITRVKRCMNKLHICFCMLFQDLCARKKGIPLTQDAFSVFILCFFARLWD